MYSSAGVLAMIGYTIYSSTSTSIGSQVALAQSAKYSYTMYAATSSPTFSSSNKRLYASASVQADILESST